MWVLERCPMCKGEGFVGQDGHGYSYVCDECEGHQVGWMKRAHLIPLPSPRKS